MVTKSGMLFRGTCSFRAWPTWNLSWPFVDDAFGSGPFTTCLLALLDLWFICLISLFVVNHSVHGMQISEILEGKGLKNFSDLMIWWVCSSSSTEPTPLHQTKGEQLGFCYHPGNSQFCPCHNLPAWYSIRLLIRELKQILYHALKWMWHRNSGQCQGDTLRQGRTGLRPIILSRRQFFITFFLQHMTLHFTVKDKGPHGSSRRVGVKLHVRFWVSGPLALEISGSLCGSFWFVLLSFDPLLYWYNFLLYF